jgi:hypothetical protein
LWLWFIQEAQMFLRDHRSSIVAHGNINTKGVCGGVIGVVSEFGK